jgi:parallel beta-helix repeat protein
MAVTVTYTQTSAPTYTVAIEGSNYVARNSAGTSIATNTDFGAMMTTLNSKLVSGDMVLITNGVYLTSTCPTITKTHVTFTGQGNSIIRAASTTTPSNELFMIYNGGSYDTLDNLIFDANFNTLISPVVLIGGSYNVVENCELRNAIQYGIQSWKADHFKFINNKIGKAQYGLCTGGDAAGFSTNGLISGNTITDAQDCGVKIKWAKNCQINNNTIDVGYVTWTKNASGSTTEGGRGIDFYTDDGPDYNCSATGNTITDSKQNRVTEGFIVDSDKRLADPSQPASYGLSINDNYISGCYYGILIKKASEVTYSGNTFSGIRYKNIDITG